jgi:uncharacterized protein YkuJ
MNLRGKVKSIKELAYYNRNSKLKNEFHVQFDSIGNKVIEIFKFSDNTVRNKIAYQYNYENHSFKQIYSDDKGSILLRTIFEINKMGKITSMTIYDKNNKIINNGKLIYNADGKLKTVTSLDTKGNITMEVKYVYDSLGFIRTKESILVNEHFRFQYIRNTKGFPVKIMKFNSNGVCIEKSHYSYTYDKKGNWIERTEMLNDSIYEYKTRKLTYY